MSKVNSAPWFASGTFESPLPSFTIVVGVSKMFALSLEEESKSSPNSKTLKT